MKAQYNFIILMNKLNSFLGFANHLTVIFLIIKMKREYSFNQISQITMGVPDCQNKHTPSSFYTASKQNRDSWTDMRVEQIKKKYDTPSHRKTPSNFGVSQKSREHYQPDVNSSNPYSSYRNALRDSLVSPNVAKKDYGLPINNRISTFKEQSFQKNSLQDIDHAPRFSYDTKQNSSFLDKFANIKNSMKVESKLPTRELNKLNEYPSSKIDPRVQNIDKINMKIKKILDCLHENENYTNEKGKHQQLKSSFLKGSIMSKGGQSQDLQQTKILSRYSLSPQVKQESSLKWRLEEKYNHTKSSQSFLYENQKNINQEAVEQSSSWFEPQKNGQSRNRARSCLGSFKHEDIQLHSGKKLNDQITKINTRIKQFEQQKKKLNIDFKPYNYEMKTNKSTSNLIEHRTQRGSKPPLPKSSYIKPTQYTPSHQKRYNVVDKLKTEEDEHQPRYTMDVKRSFNYQQYKPLSKINSSLFQIDTMESYKLEQKRQKTATPQFEQHSFQQVSQAKPETKDNENENCSNELKQKTEQGIENRKRKLLQTATVTFSRQTKKLISNLFEQVKLDEDLRNAKIWYRDLLNSNKAQLLNKQLQNIGAYNCELSFQVTEEEDNPFYSVRESQQSFTSLVDRWVRAQKYWKQNIQGQFDLKQFAVEKFTNQKLDLQKKGYFVVEDLVRFLNMETGTFYRNRDLILVFRRLSKGNKLHWEQFLSILDQQNLN